MAETVTYRRFFFSADKETSWLNGLGQNGLRLVMREDHKYEFEKTEDKVWYYAVEWFDNAADSEQMQPYLERRAGEGVTLCASWSLWGYLVSETPIAPDEEMLSRTAKHYSNPAWFLFLLDAVALFVLYFQLKARPILEKNGVTLTSPVRSASDNPIKGFFLRLLYGGKVLLYKYGKFWSRFFGDSQAATVIGIILPLLLIFSVIAFVRLYESCKYSDRRKKLIKERKEKEALQDTEKEADHAEQEVS